MTISEKTRLARVGRWTSLKNAWEAKLSKAVTENATLVAKKMIAEAEDMLSKLESKGGAITEIAVYEKPFMDKGTKKVKSDKAKKDKETSDKAEENTNIGL